MKRLFILLLVLAVVVSGAYLFMSGHGGEVVRVGGKKFSESYIMGEMLAAVLEAEGFTVERRFDMGSGVVREALEHGQVDLYWEYTGTAYVMHHQLDDPSIMRDSSQVYEAVRALDAGEGLVWLEPATFNNTYTLMMARETAEALGIGTVSDLANHVTSGDTAVTLASNAEWYARPDGFQGLGAHYGFVFPLDQVVKMESGLIYPALRDGKVDVGMGYSTDARIMALDLLPLEDDLAFFPKYNPAPVVRTELLEAHPQIAEALNAISQRLTTEEILQLNYRVDMGKESPRQVAGEWLSEQGLLP